MEGAIHNSCSLFTIIWSLLRFFPASIAAVYLCLLSALAMIYTSLSLFFVKLNKFSFGKKSLFSWHHKGPFWGGLFLSYVLCIVQEEWFFSQWGLHVWFFSYFRIKSTKDLLCSKVSFSFCSFFFTKHVELVSKLEGGVWEDFIQVVFFIWLTKLNLSRSSSILYFVWWSFSVQSLHKAGVAVMDKGGLYRWVFMLHRKICCCYVYFVRRVNTHFNIIKSW